MKRMTVRVLTLSIATCVFMCACERDTQNAEPQTVVVVATQKTGCVFRIYPGTALPDARHTSAFYIIGTIQEISDDKKEILLDSETENFLVDRFVVSDDPKDFKDCNVGETWAFKVSVSATYFGRTYYELICDTLW